MLWVQEHQIWQSRVMTFINDTFTFESTFSLNFKFTFTNWRSVQSFYWTPFLYQVLPVGPPPPIILPPVPIFKQCTDYMELNSPTRKFSASGGNKNCDKGWWSDPNDGNFGSPIDWSLVFSNFNHWNQWYQLDPTVFEPTTIEPNGFSMLANHWSNDVLNW